jgi:hypothetical protein
MRFRLVFVLVSVAALVLPAAASAISAPSTLSYTGGEQAYVVPSGVVAVGVAVQGAWGGQDNSTNGVNQAGEGVTGYLSVTPGELLYAEVGQNGAYAGGATFGGGGAGGDPPSTVYGGAGEYASSGGGASDVRTCSMNATSCVGGGTSLGSRLIVAAGGGGWAGSGNGFSPTCSGPLGAGGANNVQTNLPSALPGGPAPVVTAAGIVIPGLASNQSSTVTTTYAGTSNAGFGSSIAGSGGVLSGCSSGGGNPTLTFSDSVAGSSGSGADGGTGGDASGLPPFSGDGCTGTECADAGPGGGGGGGYFGGGGGATGYDSCLETQTSPPSSAPCNAAGPGQGGAGGSSFVANAVQFPSAPGVLGNTADQFIRFVPAIEIDTPTNGAVYVPGQSVDASWSCGYDAATALGPGNNCSGTVASGSPIDTSPGTHTFTVAGKVNNNASDSLNATVTYTVASATRATKSPPHSAKILKAKINKQKHEATFTFSASGTVTGFDCALVPPTKKGKHHKKTKVKFGACRSPKTYKHLKQGKYTFEVKAFNTAGTSNTVIKHLSI